MNKSRKSSENLKIFQTIINVFGDQDNRCRVQTFWDETQKYWIDIVNCPESPIANVISYATIALSDFNIGKMVGDVPLGIEIIGTCSNDFSSFAGILSSCAFNIIIDKSSCFPGAIYTNIIDKYYPELSMKHILFVPPFGWEEKFETLEFQTKKVAWLQAIPISIAEFQYAKEKGSSMLQSLLQEKQVNIFDLTRKSAL